MLSGGTVTSKLISTQVRDSWSYSSIGHISNFINYKSLIYLSLLKGIPLSGFLFSFITTIKLKKDIDKNIIEKIDKKIISQIPIVYIVYLIIKIEVL